MFKSKSPDETKKIGFYYGERAKAGEVYCLYGGLGAGKTVFAKGFALGLGVPCDEVVSPTFTIAREYGGRLPFFHLDVYRLGAEDMLEIGFFDYIGGDGVTLIEWAERVEELLPPGSVRINITRDAADDGARFIDGDFLRRGGENIEK